MLLLRLQRGICYLSGISESAIKRDALTMHIGSAAHICTEATKITFHCVFVHPFSFTN